MRYGTAPATLFSEAFKGESRTELRSACSAVE